MSSEEQSKLAVLKTDVPDLYAVAAAPSSASTLDASIPQFTDEKTREAAPDTALNAPAEKPDASNLKADTADIQDANRQLSPAEQDSPSASPRTAITEQELEAQAGPIATFKVSTKAVVVDVVVTDAKGHPVRGLPQRDFQLTEDSKPQDVRSFREFTDATHRPCRLQLRPPPQSCIPVSSATILTHPIPDRSRWFCSTCSTLHRKIRSTPGSS